MNILNTYKQACIDALGNELVEKYKDDSVFAYGNTDEGIYCFMWLNSTEKKLPHYTLTHDKDWDHYVVCIIKDNGETIIKERKI